MSRIRQIKPSWFLDKALRRGTTAEAREFYIGLWMLADDAGWLVWDAERIAAELYPYDSTARRERNVERWAGELERLDPAAPHLIVYDCGHASVPKMAAHQRIAGTRTVSTKARHQELCRAPRSRLELDGATGSHGRVEVEVGNGTERNGTVTSPAGARKAAPAASTEFQAKVPRP